MINWVEVKMQGLAFFPSPSHHVAVFGNIAPSRQTIAEWPLVWAQTPIHKLNRRVKYGRWLHDDWLATAFTCSLLMVNGGGGREPEGSTFDAHHVNKEKKKKIPHENFKVQSRIYTHTHMKNIPALFIYFTKWQHPVPVTLDPVKLQHLEPLLEPKHHLSS